MPLNDVTTVEEADVGICGDGWDNFLLQPDCEELREYRRVLKRLGAEECSAVIAELLAWVDSQPDKPPIELSDPNHPENRQRLDILWRRYLAASRQEQPLERARKKAPQKKKPRMPITDRDYYEFFGPEDANTRCRSEGCARGTVQHSVNCRSHHFENVMRKPCPWNDSDTRR